MYKKRKHYVLGAQVENEDVRLSWKRKSSSDALRNLAYSWIEKRKRVPYTKDVKEQWEIDVFNSSQDELLSVGSDDCSVESDSFKSKRLEEVSSTLTINNSLTYNFSGKQLSGTICKST